MRSLYIFESERAGLVEAGMNSLTLLLTHAQYGKYRKPQTILFGNSRKDAGICVGIRKIWPYAVKLMIARLSL